MTEESKEIIGIIKDMFEGLNDKMTTLHNELKSEITEVKERVTKIETHLENITDKNINALVDGHIQNAAKLDRLESIGDDVEYIKLNMGVVEAVTKIHSYDIDRLKKVK